MKRTCLLTLTLLCLFMGAVAQPRTGPMSGFVYEITTDQFQQRRQALVGAVIEVFAPTDTLHTTTDLNGNFHLKQVPSGDVRVRVTYLGYKPHVQDSVHIAPLFSCGPSNVL